jgi:dTDP-4-dehydrorhamnose 3,5-epimerase
MHGRLGRGEAKLVRCAHGAVLDVVVDASGVADVRPVGEFHAGRRVHAVVYILAGSCTGSRH